MHLQTIGVKVDGISTDIAVGNYENRILIVLSQTQKFGTIIKVDREIFAASENQENIYNIQSIFGADSEVLHVFVRILVDYINSPKSIIFILNLKDYSKRTTEAFIEVVKNLKI